MLNQHVGMLLSPYPLVCLLLEVKNSKMSPYTKWAYLAVQPFLDDAGIETIHLLPDDFAQFAVDPKIADEVGVDQD